MLKKNKANTKLLHFHNIAYIRFSLSGNPRRAYTKVKKITLQPLQAYGTGAFNIEAFITGRGLQILLVSWESANTGSLLCWLLDCWCWYLFLCPLFAASVSIYRQEISLQVPSPLLFASSFFLVIMDLFYRLPRLYRPYSLCSPSL